MDSNIQLKQDIITFREGIIDIEKELQSISLPNFQNGKEFLGYLELVKIIIEDFKRYNNSFLTLQLNETSVAWDMGVLIPLERSANSLYLNHVFFWTQKVDFDARYSELGTKIYQLKKCVEGVSLHLSNMISNFIYENIQE